MTGEKKARSGENCMAEGKWSQRGRRPRANNGRRPRDVDVADRHDSARELGGLVAGHSPRAPTRTRPARHSWPTTAPMLLSTHARRQRSRALATQVAGWRRRPATLGTACAVGAPQQGEQLRHQEADQKLVGEACWPARLAPPTRPDLERATRGAALIALPTRRGGPACEPHTAAEHRQGWPAGRCRSRRCFSLGRCKSRAGTARLFSCVLAPYSSPDVDSQPAHLDGGE